MSRRILAPLAALSISAALVFTGGLTATAAPVAPTAVVQASKVVPNKVTISKIKTTKVNKTTKKATIKPVVKATGKVKLSSSKITVKKGKKTIAKNVTSAKLKAGSYSVTTTAKYKTWKNVTTTKTVTSKKLIAKRDEEVAVTCKFKESDLGDVTLGFFTGEESDIEPVDIVSVTSSCSGGFDGSFDVLGFFLPDTKRNVALAVDGYYGWFTDSVSIRGGVPPVPEKSGQQSKLTAFAPKDLYLKTKTVQKVTTKVWSKEQTKTLKQTLTVKK